MAIAHEDRNRQLADFVSDQEIDILEILDRKVLWLSSWMIHHANHVRPSRDGLKVGGHQASSASVATLMTALYFHILRPSDRVAVKPHASPVFHAIQYLLGRQKLEALESFRAFGGAQEAPPSGATTSLRPLRPCQEGASGAAGDTRPALTLVRHVNILVTAR